MQELCPALREALAAGHGLDAALHAVEGLAERLRDGPTIEAWELHDLALRLR